LARTTPVSTLRTGHETGTKLCTQRARGGGHAERWLVQEGWAACQSRREVLANRHPLKWELPPRRRHQRAVNLIVCGHEHNTAHAPLACAPSGIGDLVAAPSLLRRSPTRLGRSTAATAPAPAAHPATAESHSASSSGKKLVPASRLVSIGWHFASNWNGDVESPKPVITESQPRCRFQVPTPNGDQVAVNTALKRPPA